MAGRDAAQPAEGDGVTTVQAPLRATRNGTNTKSAEQPTNEGDDATAVLSPEAIDEVTAQAPLESLGEGDELGQYVVERTLGEGGGGTVYAARHKVLGRRVAIKVLRPEMAAFPSMVTRFVREAAAVNTIGHPGIVDIYEFGEVSPGHPYYVMELLDGMDLRKLLQLHGRFTPSEAYELLEPVCQAVQAAHDAGYIHRDIKANNVVVVEQHGRRMVKLLDFGIAKMIQSEGAVQGLTEPGVQLGTAHNMAPEQIRCDKLDGRADVYALGVLLYQLLTGQYPFHADDPRKIALLHLQAPAPRPSAIAPIAPAVDAVVLRCLEKKPEQRYQSVSELLDALQEAVGEATLDTAAVERMAVGVYYELSSDDDDLDDDMIEDMSYVLDSVEQALTERGFAFPLHTSNAILGVLIVDEAELSSAREGTAEVVHELSRSLADREGAQPGLSLSASVRAAGVLVRESSAGVEIAGGPLLEMETWTEAHHIESEA